MAQVEVHVSVGIVTELKGLSGGINPVIDKIRTIHLINVHFDGQNSMILSGQDEAIIDLEIEWLHQLLKKASKQTKSLGNDGTVQWTFQEKQANLITSLFKVELKELESIETFKRNEILDKDKLKFLTMWCKYSAYPEVSKKIESIESSLKSCDYVMTNIDLREKNLAKRFAETALTSCYCSFSENPCALYFHGRQKDHCNIGKEAWNTFKTTKVTDPTTQQSYTESKMKGSSAKEAEQVQTNMSENKNNNTENEQHNQPLKVMESDWENQGPTCSPSTEMNNSPAVQPSPTNESESNTAHKSDYNGKISGKNNLSKAYTSDKHPPENIHNDATDTTQNGARNNVDHPIKNDERKHGQISGTGEDQKYLFDCFGIKVAIYKASITDLKTVDAITNAANENLMHGAGVAHAISKAAGYTMNQECEAYINKNGKIPTSKNFVSKPGNIKCKGIIHAVGPVWYEYPDKEKCAEDLYKTVINVLEATKKKGWKSVALPAISSGIYGVPKELCADMYVMAIVDFGSEPGSVKEVHFIDINRDILDMAIESHKKWVVNPSLLSFKNALNYLSVSSSRTKTTASALESTKGTSGDLIKFMGEDRTGYGERRFKYMILERLMVNLYTGDLLRLDSVDAIVVPLQPGLNGGVLADEVKKIGGESYKQDLGKYSKSKVGDVFVCKTSRKMKVIHVIFVPITSTDKKSLISYANVCKCILTADYNASIQTIAMPLFGAARFTEENDFRNLCQCLMAEIIDTCSVGKRLPIKELHLVNKAYIITELLQALMKQWSFGTPAQTVPTLMHMYHGASGASKGSYLSKDEAQYALDTGGWIEHKPLPTSHDNTSVTGQEADKDKIANKNDDTNKLMEGTASETCPYHTNKQSSLKLGCGRHSVCDLCAMSIKDGSCTICKQSKSEAQTCPICQENLKKPETLDCGHMLCKDCLSQLKKHKPACPICGYHFGLVTGNQPAGRMFYKIDSNLKLPGFDSCGTIIIRYDMPGGTQKKNHPHPGQRYTGIQRVAFLPNNDEGNEVLLLLRRAFDRKLIFTIGESRTTGKEGVITWNDIHHKTRSDGGPQRFGYPDPTYLRRVKEELAAKGVVS